jgi:hypothetical protein
MPKKQREIARSRKGSFGKWRSASRANKALDLDRMKQAVGNAIDIYEKEISGRPVETNLDDIVNRALARAKEQVVGGALLRLGEREAGTARLEEAVGVYQAAFPEETRVQAPVQWAQNQRC